MSFSSEERKIRQIFVGDTKFEIPRNQRKYVWDEKQWKELLGDIKYIYINKKNEQNQSCNSDFTHFIGSFVLQEENKNYIIIDGQQRITTIMIILSSLCLMFNELKNNDEFGITRQYLLGNIGLSSEYIRLHNNDLKILSLIIEKTTHFTIDAKMSNIFKDMPYDRTKNENKRILQCFYFYYNQFKELADKDKVTELVIIRDIILDMKVIHIVSKDELDCYDIFEILNARGVDLKDSELLKNYIYKYVKPKYTVDEAKEKWKMVEQNMRVCKDNMEQFLMHFATYKFGKPDKNDGVFRTIKFNAEKTKVKELLDDIVNSSENYKFFYNTELITNDNIRNCLEYFKMINHRQFRPLFLALFSANCKKNINDKELEETIVFLKNFYFAFGTVIGKTSNLIENRIYEYANKIENKFTVDILKKLRQDLLVFYPVENDFKSMFINISYSNKNKLYTNSNNKKIANYVLLEIEKYFQQTSEVICNIKNCNIEHIKLDSENDSYPCKIGNLLLIDESLNGKMKDKSFEDKVLYLKKSQLNIVKKFLSNYGDKDDWNDDNINQRGIKLAELAYKKVWKI